MTTVGLGEEVPKTALGMIISSVIIVMGIGVLAFPVAVLSNNFNTVYNASLAEESEMELRRIVLGISRGDEVWACPPSLLNFAYQI